MVRCEVSTKYRRIPVNLLVDYERSCELELHNRAAHGIKVDTDGGIPVTIHLPGFNITVPRREHGDEDFLNEFTRLYSRELGETACVGAIGSKVLQKYHVTFDLHDGFVYLRPPRAENGVPLEENEGAAVTSVTLTNDLVWFPVRLADDKILSMSLGTTQYDTVIDETMAEAMGKPAGDIGSVRVKDFDLARYVALRPEELVQVHPDGALGTLGLNVLEHFRVEVDRVNRSIKFEETKAAEFPTADLAYFTARLDEEAQPLVSWLNDHPGARLGREASERLLELLLDEDAAAKDFGVALDWMDRTRIDDLRATEALKTMDTLLAARRADVAVMAGEIGVKSGRKDRYPESVPKLHSRLGELLLEQKQNKKAWEHLLSAAFGLPEDGVINLNLGRFYERAERYRRAMSRYIQAVITPEAGPLAVAALERVQQKMGGEPLSVDLVDKLIAGKVHNFGAATKFEPKRDNTTNRVVLVELFTNAHFGRRLREGWRSFAVGGSMALEGLLSHFPRSHVVALSYHLPSPEPTALQNELSLHMAESYGISRPMFTKINGTVTGPGAERWRKAEPVYERNRSVILDELLEPTDYEILGQAEIKDGVLSGEVTVKGPKKLDVFVQLVLAERGVLYPGKAKVVVHRMVARASLLDSLDGVAFVPKDGKMTVPFSRKLAELTQEHEAFLEGWEARSSKSCTRLSTRIDPRQVRVIAVVRSLTSRRVLQARQITPNGAKGR